MYLPGVHRLIGGLVGQITAQHLRQGGAALGGIRRRAGRGERLEGAQLPHGPVLALAGALADDAEVVGDEVLVDVEGAQTGAGLLEEVVDDRVTELDFGEWEMKSFDELYKDDVRFRLWCDGDYVNTPSPGGESFAGQIKRFKSFIDEKKNQGFKRIAVFTHGGILACGLIMTGQAEAKNALSVVPPYGSVVCLTV